MKLDKGKIIAIVAGAIALIVIIVLAIMFIRGRNNDNDIATKMRD